MDSYDYVNTNRYSRSSDLYRSRDQRFGSDYYRPGDCSSDRSIDPPRGPKAHTMNLKTESAPRVLEGVSNDIAEKLATSPQHLTPSDLRRLKLSILSRGLGHPPKVSSAQVLTTYLEWLKIQSSGPETHINQQWQSATRSWALALKSRGFTCHEVVDALDAWKNIGVSKDSRRSSVCRSVPSYHDMRRVWETEPSSAPLQSVARPSTSSTTRPEVVPDAPTSQQSHSQGKDSPSLLISMDPARLALLENSRWDQTQSNVNADSKSLCMLCFQSGIFLYFQAQNFNY